MNDFANGMFEFVGAFFVLLHCKNLYRDKLVRGLSIWPIIYFFSWGVWNLHYYPSLNQVWSFRGGVAVCATNALHVAMLIYYLRKEKANGA